MSCKTHFFVLLAPRIYYHVRGAPQGSILGQILFNLAVTKVAQNLEGNAAVSFSILEIE